MKQWGILRLDRRFSHFPCINLTVYNGFSTILQANKTVGLDNKTHDGLYYPCMEAGRSGRGCSSAQEVKTKRLRPDIKQVFPALRRLIYLYILLRRNFMKPSKSC